MLTTRRYFGLLLFAVIAFGVVSCSSDDDSSNGDATSPQEGAESQLCGDLAALDESVRQFQALSPSSTVDDFKAVAEEVESAYNDVKDSGGELQDATVEAFDEAVENLKSAVNALSGDDSLGTASLQVQVEVTAIGQVIAQADSEVVCP